MLRLAAEGVSKAEIARRLKIGEVSVYRILAAGRGGKGAGEAAR